MGCDIHMYAEVRNAAGKWEKVGAVFDSPWYDPSRETKTYEDGYVLNAPKTDHPYDDRNYTLFAILADVRNGYGFAGTVTHKPIEPFFTGRGVPEDASEEYKEIVADWDCDGHSHTYASLAELKAAPWDSVEISRVGFLDAQEYERIRNSDLDPETWCGDVSGYMVQKITPQVYEREYRNVITDKAVEHEEMMSIYIYYAWTSKLSNDIGTFLDETIPSLEKLKTSNLSNTSDNALERVIADEDIRIVFFFDN